MAAHLKGRMRMLAAVTAAFAVSIGGLAVAGTAAAAPAPEYAPTGAAADDIGTLAIPCTTGTGWTGDNPTSQNYAWARCDASGSPNPNYWAFRVEWSCTGESQIRLGPYLRADGRTLRGYCPAGKRVDYSSVGTLYTGDIG
ncbi:hypothetical protein SAMN05216298_2168 [Glycomyces sambucus]|uniref:Uncharacterized protein n=1 Tax=Glycomyces sambucus TaxID=380244 RepID=A0A1G9G3A1_9ACTN|nr:hypothetical protein [Glycomyces sambucus]SDK94743.1 hypothetical protein SAMN05216298_2168 [Glycomyces sambucus]